MIPDGAAFAGVRATENLTTCARAGPSTRSSQSHGAGPPPSRDGWPPAIPYFDPWDGGVDADVRYILEAPGGEAVRSGFLSRNNPDETAKNFWELNRSAGIPRRRTVTWNVVPWYIGSRTRIRAANGADVKAGSRPLDELLGLLPKLRAVVLIGRKAQRAAGRIARLRPGVRVFRPPHPSPPFVNRAPGNRNGIARVLAEVAKFLRTTRPAA